MSLKTSEFWAMAGVILVILITSAISDSLNDVRAWTLVVAVSIGYMLSRGLASMQISRTFVPAGGGLCFRPRAVDGEEPLLPHQEYQSQDVEKAEESVWHPSS